MRAFVCFCLCLLLSVPAGAESFGVRQFIPAKPGDDLISRQFRDLIDARLAQRMPDAYDKGKCQRQLIDISPGTIKAIETEKALNEAGLTDPKTRTPIGPIAPESFLDGVIGADDDIIYYVLDFDGKAGAIPIKIEGAFRQSELFAEADKAADQVFEKLCSPRAFHVAGRVGDLTLDEDICDVTMPFDLHAKGLTAGIILHFFPKDDKGGSFSVSGTAVQWTWSGGGSYTLSADDKAGTLSFDGSYTGRYGGLSSTHPAQISMPIKALESCFGTSETPASTPAKPARKKKK